MFGNASLKKISNWFSGKKIKPSQKEEEEIRAKNKFGRGRTLSDPYTLKNISVLIFDW